MACAVRVRCSSGNEAAVVLGNSKHAGLASGLGLDAPVISPPLGRGDLAWRPLRAMVKRGGFGELRAWSARSKAAAVVAGFGAAVVRDHGVPIAGLGSTLDIGSRDRTRESLGVAPEWPMVALLADPARLGDARRFAYMIGLLDVAEMPIAGLIDPRAAHLVRARRFHAEARVRWRLRVCPGPLAGALHACELAVVVPPEPVRPPTRWEREGMNHSILRAHALGVPTVGGSAWLDDGVCPPEARDALDAEEGVLLQLARKLSGLLTDPARRAEVASTVRGHALARIGRAEEGSP